MIRLILTLLAAMAITAPAFAADTSSGCGLGWHVTTKNSLFASTIRNTTHAVLPNTFSMTFGSSGCGHHSIVQKDREAYLYFASNHDPILMEMAEGGGEYLDGFARSLGCGDGARASFGPVAQKHFQEIVRDGKATPVEMFYNVKSQIRANPVLSRVCSA